MSTLITGGPVRHSHRNAVAKNEAATVRQTDPPDALRAVADCMPGLFFVLDQEWRFTYLNSGCDHLLAELGKTRAGVLGKVLWEEFPLLVRTNLCRELHRARAENVSVQFDAFFPRPRAWFAIWACPAGGALCVHAHDVTAQRRVEEELRVKSAAIESSPTAIHLADPEGRITYVNPAFLKLWGFKDPSQALGRPIVTFWQPANKLDEARSALAVNGWWSGEITATRMDGTAVTVWHSAAVVRNLAGSPVAMVGSCVDITQQRRAEEQRRQSEQRFRLLAERAPDVIYRLRLDPAPRVEYMSPAVTKVTGYTPEEYIADPDLGLKTVHPEDRPLLERMRRGEVGVDQPVVLRWVRKDGTIAWTEQRNVRLHDETGRFIGIEGIARDVTDRETALRALKHQQATLQAILDAAVDGIVTADVRGTMISFNSAAERIFGYKADEVIGQNVSLLMPPPDREHDDEYIARYLRTGQKPVIGMGREMQGLRKDGTVFPVYVALGEAVLGDQQLFTAVVRDLTEQRRHEAALLRLSRAVEQIADSVLITDANGVIEYVNRAFEEITGYRREEAIGRKPNILKSGRHEDAFYRKLWETILAGNTFRAVFCNRRKNGELYYEERTITPVRGSGGELLCFVSTGKDITERLRVEKALRNSEARYRRLVDASPDAILVEQAGRIVFANHAAAKLFRARAVPWLIGSSLQELVHPKDRALLRQWSEKPRPAEAREKELRIRILRPDGSVAHVEGSAIASSYQGKPAVHFVLRDVSERIRAEKRQRRLRRALKNAAHKWTRTFDSIEFAIVVLDRHDRIRRVNRAAAELAGRPYLDLIGQPAAALGQNTPWQELLAVATTVRDTWSPVASHVRNQASGRSWELSALPVAYGEEPERIVLVARDVTRIMELQDALRRSEHMSAMGALVAGVAHEVRNPLFAISATLDAFEKRMGLTSEYQPYAQHLRAQLERLSRLMHELLEYGRPLRVDRTVLPLRPLVQHAIEACAGLAEDTGVRVVVDAPDPGPRITADQDGIITAFRNMIENALQHSPRGAEVVVRVREVSEAGTSMAECAVLDAGPGFPEQDLEGVFDPFFTRRRGGTGLGLSIVQRIVEGHGGRVSARNRPEGGAMVTATFPLAQT